MQKRIGLWLKNYYKYNIMLIICDAIDDIFSFT